VTDAGKLVKCRCPFHLPEALECSCVENECLRCDSSSETETNEEEEGEHCCDGVRKKSCVCSDMDCKLCLDG